MKRTALSVLSVTVLGMLLMINEQGDAATATGTLAVTATVTATCSITTAGVAFGSWSGSTVLSTGSVTVTCTNAAPWHISLDSGSTIGHGTRAMGTTGVCPCLVYELYKDTARTVIWGDSDFGNTYPPGSSLAGTGTGAAQANTVYAKTGTTNGGTPSPGNITDNVVATVNF